MNEDEHEDMEDLDENWQEEFGIHVPHSAPIDKAFYPFDSEEPFTSCTMCQKVFEEDTDFVVEKAVKGNDVIFELAICVPCAEDMRKQLSKDSLERIEAYMARVDFRSRAEQFIEKQSSDIKDYIGRCLVTDEPIDSDEEHQIYAYCKGRNMFFSAMPYAMSGAVMDEIQELLSPETKQEMDDFMDQYLIPDDLKDLLKGRPVLI